MRLTISNLRKDDFGYYHCVARNELNATMVNFEIARRLNGLLTTFLKTIELHSLPTPKINSSRSQQRDTICGQQCQGLWAATARERVSSL